MTESDQGKRAQIVSDYGYGIVRQQACVRLWLAMVCATALTVGTLSLRFFQNNTKGATLATCVVLSPYFLQLLLLLVTGKKRQSEAFLRHVNHVCCFGLGMFLLAFLIASIDQTSDMIVLVMLAAVAAQNMWTLAMAASFD